MLFVLFNLSSLSIKHLFLQFTGKTISICQLPKYFHPILENENDMTTKLRVLNSFGKIFYSISNMVLQSMMVGEKFTSKDHIKQLRYLFQK